MYALLNVFYRRLFFFTSILSILHRYDDTKKFYCPVSSSGKTDCLGKRKGRRYPQMDPKSKAFLENYYTDSNKKLAELLVSIAKPIPDWLQAKLDMYDSLT